MAPEKPFSMSSSGVLPDRAQQGVRSETLVRVRWLSITCQLVTIIIVGLGLGYPMPLLICLCLIAVSAVINLYAKFGHAGDSRLTERQSTPYLAFDILQLSALLFFTGGLQNPFSMFLMAPVFISATSLKPGYTIFLGILVVLTSSMLVDFHYPLPWPADQPFELPTVYNIGLWVALMTCLVFISSYAFRVAEESRKLASALNATGLVLAREQHLSALDGMAAAAAHELGTPLSTIAVVARELEREWSEDTPLGADIALIVSQANRCREILGKLTSLPSDNEGPMVSIRFTDLAEELADPHRNFGIDIRTERHSSVVDAEVVPHVLRLPGMLYGLGNLIENAVDFAKQDVVITLAWDEDVIIFKIIDDGPGFTEAVADRLGEPFVTNRKTKQTQTDSAPEGGGLGLGIFIAKTLLERTGASISFANRSGANTGADITIVWPKDQICLQENSISMAEI